jgi:hypothetical protein
MPSELAPIDIGQIPAIAALVEEVRATRKPKRIMRGNEEMAILMPAPARVRRRPRQTRGGATPVTDQTAGILKQYRLARPLTPHEEREAFEQGVAEQVTESMRS